MSQTKETTPAQELRQSDSSKLLGEVLIWNKKQGRRAVIEEISEMISENGLFINYYCYGDQVGEVFVDIKNPWDREFEIRYD